MKKLYVYDRLDVCDPGSGAWHAEGGLVVVTAGDPSDAVKPGTGDEVRTKFGEKRHSLPSATHVYVVPDDSPDVVIPFPDSGCC